MQHRTVGDLMTRPVVTVQRDTPFKEVAKLLVEYDITAVPVVDDDDRPLGVVSEADLLHKEAGQPEPGGWLSVSRPPVGGAAKGAGVTAGGLMTSPAIVAWEVWSVVEAARAMEEHQVKRLPVVDEVGKLVGVISRTDLVRVFLRQDHAIREEIVADVLTRTLRLAPAAVTVSVVDGRVTLHGTLDHKSLIPVVVGLCQGVDGVVDVSEHFEYRHDDTQAPARSRR